MRPMHIIQKFQLDTSTNENDFLVAADLADDYNLTTFAELLRNDFEFLTLRSSVIQLRRLQISLLNEGYGQLSSFGEGIGEGLGGGYGDSSFDEWGTPPGSGHGDGLGYGGLRLKYDRDCSDGAGSNLGEGYGIEDNNKHGYGLGQKDGSGQAASWDEFNASY